MKRLVICILLLALILSGCVRRVPPSLVQPEDQVVSIEILDVYRWHEHTPGDPLPEGILEVVCEISNHEEILNALHQLPRYRPLGDPLLGFHGHTIRITYQDGSFEMIGEACSYYETPDGEWHYKHDRFNHETFEDFLSTYIGYRTGVS